MRTECRRMADNKRRKRRADRSLRIKASLILCLLVLFFAGISSMSVSAGAKPGVETRKDMTKVYTSYTVQQGDNMYSIAKDNCNLDYYDSYEDYIREIEEINHILDDKIYSGRSITIPRYI